MCHNQFLFFQSAEVLRFVRMKISSISRSIKAHPAFFVRGGKRAHKSLSHNSPQKRQNAFRGRPNSMKQVLHQEMTVVIETSSNTP